MPNWTFYALSDISQRKREDKRGKRRKGKRKGGKEADWVRMKRGKILFSCNCLNWRKRKIGKKWKDMCRGIDETENPYTKLGSIGLKRQCYMFSVIRGI